MSFMLEQTTLEFLEGPMDGQQIEDDLLFLLANARTSAHFLSYGTTLKGFFQGLKDCQRRGVDVAGYFDGTQLSGPHEKVQVLDLIEVLGQDKFGFGGSGVHGAIMHDKALWINYRPDLDLNTIPVVTDWHDAVNEGLPVTLVGSFNFTESAKNQDNVVFIVPGALLAGALEARLQKLLLTSPPAKWQGLLTRTMPGHVGPTGMP